MNREFATHVHTSETTDWKKPSRAVPSALCAALAALLVLGGCSDGLCGVIRHDRPAENYRELAKTPAFRCVGKVIIEPEAEMQRRICGSAVLIAPRWALTASHVMANDPLEKHRFVFGGEPYRAIRRIPRPAPVILWLGYDAVVAGLAAGADLALVELDRPVRNIEPAVRYRGSDEVGRTMTLVGYGCIGDGLHGMTLPPVQELRAGNNVIDAAGCRLGKLTVSGNVLLCDFDNPDDPKTNRLGSPIALDLEIGTSAGDSGGGWFLQDGSTWKLAAITCGLLPAGGDPDGSDSEKYGAVSAGCASPRQTPGSTVRLRCPFFKTGRQPAPRSPIPTSSGSKNRRRSSI